MKRPRFTLRTLAIVVTLICAYFAAWEVTKHYATSLIPSAALPSRIFSRGNNQLLYEEPTFSDEFSLKHQKLGTQLYYIFAAQSPCPFVVIQDECDCDYMGNDVEYVRSYYLWLFGPKVKLPFATEP